MCIIIFLQILRKQAFHPCLPLLASGGVDCKLRIWRLPDTLPQHPTSSIMRPIPTAPPVSSVRPPSFSQPIYTNTALHSHHIDHVSWLGSSGHLVTRSMCWDSPGRRVVRVFRPDFFDTLEVNKIPNVVGAPVTVSSDVTLFARWTVAACSDNVADGIICSANELSYDVDRRSLSSQRKIYIPTTEPAIHVYDVDLDKPQGDVDELRRHYPIRPGDEILDEQHPVRDAQLRAMDVHLGGSGWIVAVGEQEKLCVWIRKEPLDIDRLLKRHRTGAAETAAPARRAPNGLPAESHIGANANEGLLPVAEKQVYNDAEEDGVSDGQQMDVEGQAPGYEQEGTRSPSVEYV